MTMLPRFFLLVAVFALATTATAQEVTTTAGATIAPNSKMEMSFIVDGSIEILVAGEVADSAGKRIVLKDAIQTTSLIRGVPVISKLPLIGHWFTNVASEKRDAVGNIEIRIVQ